MCFYIYKLVIASEERTWRSYLKLVILEPNRFETRFDTKQ